MSLYNMFHGMHPMTVSLLAVVDLETGDIPRYRDVFVSRDGTKLYVLARIGGGNRSDYADAWEWLRLHHTYESDRDDAFDSTYAWITFRVPPLAVAPVKLLAPDEEPVLDMNVLTDRAIDLMKRGEVADPEGLRQLKNAVTKAIRSV